MIIMYAGMVAVIIKGKPKNNLKSAIELELNAFI